MMEKTFQENVLERLARIESRLNNGIVDALKDHEKRLRSLEKGLWIIIGVGGLLQILAAFFKL